MSSYSKNIARMKEASSANARFRSEQNTAIARIRGDKDIKEAERVASSLTDFSTMLKEWKIRDINDKVREGQKAAKKAKLEDAQELIKLGEEAKELEKGFMFSKEQDTRLKEVKEAMLRRSGESIYPDAERIANLSPWQQVGYAKEKIKAFDDTFSAKLEHAMSNSEKAISIGGITFTPKELRDNNIQSLPLKQAAIEVLSDDIKEAAGMNRFSDAMLKLTKHEENFQKAKDSLNTKFRTRYNVDSSLNTQAKAKLEWEESDKTSDDLYRYVLSISGTVDKNNQLIGRGGAWDLVMSQLAKEGASMNDPEYADRVGSMAMPDALAKSLGAKRGTTFAQQWPGRFTNLRSQIKKQAAAAIDAENEWLKSAGKAKVNQFIKDVRNDPAGMTETKLNAYKDWFNDNGLVIPQDINKYETAMMRDERVDKGLIKAKMASQRGFISHAQLDEFNPLAALEFRKEATRLESAQKKEFKVEKQLRGALNEVLDGMGVTTKEKSLVYENALLDAERDYDEKFNKYVAAGYPPRIASHLALYGKQGEAGEEKGSGDSFNEQGVITEINTNQAGSQYMQFGQSVVNDIEPTEIMARHIKTGKIEMIQDPEIIAKRTIGGEYGQKRINEIIENINTYGKWRGVTMSANALNYYTGLAEGKRRMSAYSLIDKQLKANGHPGLFPSTKYANQETNTSSDEVVETEPADTEGVEELAWQGVALFKYPGSVETYEYVEMILDDTTNIFRNGGRSVFDNPDVLPTWLGGTA
jgi:hypothetical protein